MSGTYWSSRTQETIARPIEWFFMLGPNKRNEGNKDFGPSIWKNHFLW
jgi:hypothetical protein